jgi:cytidine deaminase
MTEFCGKDFEILLYDGKEIRAYTLEEILPAAFTKSDLGV